MKRLLLFSCLLATIAAAQRPHRSQPRTGTPGQFDYYLLTLSWSPEYCQGHSSDTECAAGKHYGFIVHGMWPQNKDGSYPENCSSQPGLTDISSLANIMPDPGLIQHEWTTHGTCSGLSATDYFGLIVKTFQSIHIPASLVAPKSTTTMHPADIKQGFTQANQQIHSAGLAITCPSNFLTAVQVCTAKDGTPISCPSSVRDCKARNVTVPPVP